ncbi:MAG: phosphatase PAP2 family protein [Oscillospiraceae bacterium]|nr:phosphatase PAP2 family protein [Oscillospiraceae bacterium]
MCVIKTKCAAALSAVMTISFLLFAAIAFYTVSGGAEAINARLSLAVYSFSMDKPALTELCKIISNIGYFYFYLPFCAVLLILPKLTKATRAIGNSGVPMAMVMTAVSLSNHVLKQIFKIPRPDEAYHLVEASGYGFPSGHSSAAAAFAAVIIYSVFFGALSSRGRLFKNAASAAAVSFALSVGLSRIYLGVHSVTDVSAGFAWGAFTAAVCLIFFGNRDKELKNY